MINYKETGINNLIIHRIGNSNDSSILSKEEFLFNVNNEQPILINFFLKAFSNQFEQYSFFHEVELKLNPVYSCCIDIFREKDFIETSIKMANYLLSKSSHPNIKSGELYIVKFDEILVENNYCESIGIFKTETKDDFFEAYESKNEFKLKIKNGISTQKFDKGCLIFNSNEANGYKVCVIDNTNRGSDAQYWKEDFLKLKPCNDEFNNTKNFLSLTKSYITQQLPEEFEVAKADQIDLLNRSVEYFKTHDNFDKKEFETQVFQDTGIIKSFRKFDDVYQNDNELELSSKFEISPQAVKKQAKIFKSILKLDKNFAIYIHGNRQLIEQGVEKDGRKFYKIYFNEES